MQKIIDGFLYESKVVPDLWNIHTFEVNGHREISIRNAVAWNEVGNVHFDTSRMGSHLDAFGNMVFGGPGTAEEQAMWAALDASDAEERRLSALKKSAARAQTTVRRLIKWENFNELLTLTYRHNQQDRELAKKHFKEWVRRMKVALGGFRYCASFEQQERGAMHMHCATHRLPKMGNHKGVKVLAWKLGTNIWRDIVGDIEIPGPLRPGEARGTLTGGLCFVGGKPKKNGDKRRRNMSVGKMASYVSKYILKDYLLCPAEKNRYSASNRMATPFVEVVCPLRPYERRPWVRTGPVKTSCTVRARTLLEVIELMVSFSDYENIISHRIGQFKDSYWLCTEPQVPISA